MAETYTRPPNADEKAAIPNLVLVMVATLQFHIFDGIAWRPAEFMDAQPIVGQDNPDLDLGKVKALVEFRVFESLRRVMMDGKINLVIKGETFEYNVYGIAKFPIFCEWVKKVGDE